MQKLHLALLLCLSLASPEFTRAGQTPGTVSGGAGAVQQHVLRLIQKEFFVPQVGATPPGLDVLEVYFDRPGKHPLALLTHGSTGSPEERRYVTPWEELRQAQWFARRGYVVFVVVREGYGRSGGRQDNSYGACNTRLGSSAQAAEAGAFDLRFVIDFARSLPEVDTGTVVSVGHSTGGFVQVALSANPPAGLKAAISFAGGRGARRRGSNCDLPDVLDAFRSFGHDAHKHGDLPMLWIYAQNDQQFPPGMAQEFASAYMKDGAAIQFVIAPPDASNGHNLYDDVSAWSDMVQSFLKARNLLPLGDTLLPAPVAANVPMPAALKDTDAETWKSFLLAPPEKALVSDDQGRLWIAEAAFDQDIANDRAKELCKKAEGKKCMVVAKTADTK